MGASLYTTTSMTHCWTWFIKLSDFARNPGRSFSDGHKPSIRANCNCIDSFWSAVPVEGRTWVFFSHPAFFPFNGVLDLMASSSAKNAAEVSKAVCTSAAEMPWLLRVLGCFNDCYVCGCLGRSPLTRIPHESKLQ